MAEQKLTAKQEAAIQEYMINGGNKSAAYRHAYNTSKMKEEVINVKACELFKVGKVKVRLRQLQDKLEKKNEISKEWIFNQLKNVIAKSSSEEEIKGPDGGTGEYKYDSSGVNKAIDTLNKMMGYYAAEKKEISGEITTKRVINLHPTTK